MKDIAAIVDAYMNRPIEADLVTPVEAIDTAVKFITIEAEKLAVGAKMAIAMGDSAPPRAHVDANRHRRLLATIEQLRKIRVAVLRELC